MIWLTSYCWFCNLFACLRPIVIMCYICSVFFLFFPRWRLSVGLLNGLLTYLLRSCSSNSYLASLFTVLGLKTDWNCSVNCAHISSSPCLPLIVFTLLTLDEQYRLRHARQKSYIIFRAKIIKQLLIKNFFCIINSMPDSNFVSVFTL